jgi:periplasmic divalent cation tolerance protein
MTGPMLVWCPFPDEEEARRVAGVLLDEGLVVCANIIGPMVSLYQWNGERGESHEFGALFKTHEAIREAVTARLAQLHSYESPAIMVWYASAAPAATADWLSALAGQEQGFKGHGLG